MIDANESMGKITASHDKVVSVMLCKQELLEKQGKHAILWKLQEYYAAANQFEKMSSIMTQIDSLTDLLARKHDKSDDFTEVDSNCSHDDEFDDHSNFDVEELESVEVEELTDNADKEEVEKE